MTRVRQLVPIFALAAAIAVAGCHKKVAPPPPAPPPPPPTAPAAPPPPQAPPRAPAPPAAPPALTEDQIFANKSLAQLNSEKPLVDVYFDLDESTIRDDAKGPLQRNADWMKRWTSTQVTVEGHADERGSAEYNLGLGSRRADAVKQYLVSLGVQGGRITVVSKGKEQPVCTDHAESCWQQNRRGHFLITAK
jgi:peptidoglycan-associated lipoprotein